MSYFVYILLSEKDQKLYVGCTKDVDKRIEDHNSGRVLSTKNRYPFVLLYKECFAEKADAFQRERFLKSLWSGRFKKKLLNEYFNKKNTE